MAIHVRLFPAKHLIESGSNPSAKFLKRNCELRRRRTGIEIIQNFTMARPGSPDWGPYCLYVIDMTYQALIQSFELWGEGLAWVGSPFVLTVWAELSKRSATIRKRLALQISRWSETALNSRVSRAACAQPCDLICLSFLNYNEKIIYGLMVIIWIVVISNSRAIVISSKVNSGFLFSNSNICVLFDKFFNY